LSYHPAAPDPHELPPGEGHVVLVVPAFLCGDFVTLPLRRFLASCGYRPFGWEAGVNFGPTERALTALRARILDLAAREGGPISLIGVSLGGLLARDAAHDLPVAVRQVVTIGSPIRLPTASAIEPLFHLCAPFYSATIDLDRFAAMPPVPCTAIYSKEDGLVAWQSCTSGEDDSCEVGGPHLLMCRNPKALRELAHRLAPC
jgi:pimeloyl-ACP methyl ester carboxylesterase